MPFYAFRQNNSYGKWIQDGWEGFIHYLDGSVVGFCGPGNKPGLETKAKV